MTAAPSYSLAFPCAHGGPVAEADIRSTHADFYVEEVLGFTPEGSGEHVFLHIQKDGDNTAWVARQIAALAGVQNMDVGYCGLKDRHAITRQWFSVYLPKGPEPDWQQLNTSSISLLAVSRHRQKLRRGQHSCNRFCLRLRRVEGDNQQLQQRLSAVAAQGVPNYFGPQRFGIEAGNLALAQRILAEGVKINNRPKRTMALSAARSYLFNKVLAERVRQQTWQQMLDGEPEHRQAPTAPLWGRGRPLSSGAALALEQSVLAAWQPWCEGLEFTGVTQQRRALQLLPQEFTSRWEQDDLLLTFSLPVGSFATAVLRELVTARDGPAPVLKANES